MKILILAVLILFSCNRQPVKKQTAHTTANRKNAIESFVVSCGSGCAMTYTSGGITRNLPDIKVNFEVQMHVDEELTDTYEEVYIFSYTKLNELSTVHVEGEYDNVLKTLMPDGQRSFRDFGNSLVKKL